MASKKDKRGHDEPCYFILMPPDHVVQPEDIWPGEEVVAVAHGRGFDPVEWHKYTGQWIDPKTGQVVDSDPTK